MGFFNNGIPWGQADWGLKPPLNFVIEWGALTFPDAKQFVDLFSIGIEKAFNYENYSPKDFIKALGDAFPQGAFYAEFAKKTNIIYIKYLAPTTAAQAKRFPKDVITRQTIVDTSGGPKHLHFDFARNNALRSAFVMDYLEDREELLNRILNEDQRVGTTTLSVRGQKIKTEVPKPAPGQKFKKNNIRPTIFMEYPGVEFLADESTVCCDIIVNPDGTTSTVVVKIYAGSG